MALPQIFHSPSSSTTTRPQILHSSCSSTMAFPQILHPPSSSLSHSQVFLKPNNTITPSSLNPNPKFLSHRTSPAILRRRKPKFFKCSDSDSSLFENHHTNSLKSDDVTHTPNDCQSTVDLFDTWCNTPISHRSTTDLFDTWCKQYGKTYSSDQEKQYRLRVFEDSLAFVTQHNKGNYSYKVGLNAFSDLTQEEFKASYQMSFQSDSELEPETA